MITIKNMKCFYPNILRVLRYVFPDLDALFPIYFIL